MPPDTYVHTQVPVPGHPYVHTQQELIRMYTHTAQRQGNKGLEVGSMIIGMGVFFLCVASMFFLGGRLRDYRHVCVCGVCVRCLYFSLSALSLCQLVALCLFLCACLYLSSLRLSLSISPSLGLSALLSLTHSLADVLSRSHSPSLFLCDVCMYVCVYAHTHT
jgi:hypothetical protein